MTSAGLSVVCGDASVLINLCHVRRLALLGGLNLDFVMVDEVDEEILYVDQRAQIDEAVRNGWLRRVSLAALDGGQLYASLCSKMGKGEAASLAFAQANGCIVACDEGKAFKRAAKELVGLARLINTPGIYVLALRQKLIGLADADADKAILAAKRYAMPFKSFNEVI